MILKLDEGEEKRETGLCCSECIHENLVMQECSPNSFIIYWRSVRQKLQELKRKYYVLGDPIQCQPLVTLQVLFSSRLSGNQIKILMNKVGYNSVLFPSSRIWKQFSTKHHSLFLHIFAWSRDSEATRYRDSCCMQHT